MVCDIAVRCGWWGAIQISDAANPWRQKRRFLSRVGELRSYSPGFSARVGAPLQEGASTGKNFVSNQKPKDGQPTTARLAASEVSHH